jgi:hypothetical protein
MRIALAAFVTALVLLPAGCRKGPSTAPVAPTNPGPPPKQAAGPTPPPAAGGGGGGAVQAVRGAVQRAVTLHEMNNLRVFIDTASGASGRMPSREEIFASVKQGDPKLAHFLQEGAIILTGATTREGVWAYEKDAPVRGGLAVTATGVERLSPDELRQRMGGQ